MAGFVSKQPNGLYCRFSTVVDCPTEWNMTREDYINMKMQEAKEDAEDVLDNYLQPFEKKRNLINSLKRLDMIRNPNKAENNIIGGANKCRILVLKEFAIV